MHSDFAAMPSQDHYHCSDLDLSMKDISLLKLVKLL